MLAHLAGPAARWAALEEDQGDLRALAAITDGEVDGLLARGAGEDGRVFALLPEQLALAAAIARGPKRSSLRCAQSGRLFYEPGDRLDPWRME